MAVKKVGKDHYWAQTSCSLELFNSKKDIAGAIVLDDLRELMKVAEVKKKQ